jgi:Xaa-Pro aminopeptidase
VRLHRDRLRSKEYARRHHALRELLKLDGLNAILVTHPSNVRWLCGFSGSNGWLLLRPRSAVFVTDSRYDEQAHSEVHEAALLIAGQERLSDALQRSGALRNLQRLGFEADRLSWSLHRTLKRRFQGIELAALDDTVEALRRCKSQHEIDILRSAIEIAETVMQEVTEKLRPGVLERDIAAWISYRMRLLGAEGDAFPPIVLFGQRTSLIHGQPGDAALRRGDTVLIDIGCRYRGYCSDITRTFACGRIDSRLREAYEALRQAQSLAVEKACSGVSVVALDRLLRDRLAENGWDAYFTHALGHGLGMDVHEGPLLSPRGQGTLSAGNVVTIEPGIYIPGVGGLRIEDVVLPRSNGGERLTTFPRELMVL